MVQMIVWSIIIFCLLIFIHELGHFLSAKAVGIKVHEFSIGMGPALLKFGKKETQYSLRAFPIGGYVKMEGEDESSDDNRAFNNKPLWAKAIVVCAGSFMNFILTVIIMIALIWSIGTATTTVDTVMDGNPAQVAGIESGDKLISINDMNINQWTDVRETINAAGGESVEVKVERNGEVRSFTIVPAESDNGFVIGVLPTMERSAGNAGTYIVSGVKTTFEMIGMMFDFLSQLVRGQGSMDDLTGPIGIVTIIGEQAKSSIADVIYIAGLISLNLAIINMLPIPGLDGARLLFIVVRKIVGKRFTDNMEGMIHFAGFILLIGLMIYITVRDVDRFIL